MGKLIWEFLFLDYEEIDNQKKKRDAEEMGDAMKSLENRTLDSKRAAMEEVEKEKKKKLTLVRLISKT